jgi:hypothetical protein
MTTPGRHCRASRVQFSGRPSGAPSELDAAENLWNLPGHQAAISFQTQSQTRKYNLFSVISGPTIGVHFTSWTNSSPSPGLSM